MKELTTRHWFLYELLKNNDGKWMKQIEIYNQMVDFYKEYGLNESNFHDSFVRVRIGKDILDLNNSDVIHKLILTSNRGVKIATREEYKRWSDLKWSSVKRMIKRLAWKDYKYERDGQVKIKFDKKSREKEVYETFTDKRDIDDVITMFKAISKAEE
jgi:hypothetical protein